MPELDVWTVSVTLRTEHGTTKANVFLQGPAIEVECSGWADDSRRGAASTSGAADLAAGRALEDLSRRLIDRAGNAGGAALVHGTA